MKGKNWIRGLACLLAAALLLPFGACTGQAEKTSGATGITVWLGSWWEEEAERLKSEFEADNPGYTVKIELMPVNGYVENAATAILGGNSPDALALDTLMIPTLVSQNMLQPMDDFLNRYGWTKDKFSTRIYEAGVTGGVTYAAPYRTAACGLYYNKTIFDNAGVAYPTDRMDFDAFLETCQALTVPGEIYGYGIAASKSDPANVMTSFCPVLWGFGGDFLSADLTTCTLDSPESVAGITYWVELYTKYKVVPEGCINYAITKDLFPLAMNGQIAMIPMNDSNIVKIDAYAQENGFEWGVCVQPGYARAGGWSFTIPVSAGNVEGAEIWINWFLQPEILSRQQVVLPGVLEAQSLGKWGDEIYDVFYEADNYALHCPNTPHWTEIQNIVTQELQDALQGLSTPQQAAAKMAEQINPLLG